MLAITAYCNQTWSLQADYFEFAKKFSQSRDEEDSRVAVYKSCTLAAADFVLTIDQLEDEG